MGESHPAAKKVVVQFCTRDLPNITEAQRIKLIKLAGVRYNPDTDVVKMSCEKFEAPAQNKRYLGDLIGNLITEAKNSKDMFEDVPLDFRHHKPKKVPMFPEEWKMTPDRVQMLLKQRKQQMLLEKGETPVNDKQLVEDHTQALPSRVLAYS
jgi:small subunit ribosomal protein S35